jgi:hypothetical protein
MKMLTIDKIPNKFRKKGWIGMPPVIDTYSTVDIQKTFVALVDKKRNKQVDVQ